MPRSGQEVEHRLPRRRPGFRRQVPAGAVVVFTLDVVEELGDTAAADVIHADHLGNSFARLQR